MNWTKEQDDRLRTAWGRDFTKNIANELGKTKNAVIGRARRLGLERLMRRSGRPKSQRNKIVRIHKHSKTIEPPVIPVDALNIPFTELQPQHCRFPTFGEGRSILFCGHQVSDGNSFCGWHCSVAYEAPKQREAPKYHWSDSRRKQGEFNYWRAA